MPMVRAWYKFITGGCGLQGGGWAGLRLISARRRSIVWSNTERLPLRDVLFYILYKAEMIERTDRVWYTDDKKGSKQEKVWRINHVYLPRKYHCQFFGTKRKTV